MTRRRRRVGGEAEGGGVGQGKGVARRGRQGRGYYSKVREKLANLMVWIAEWDGDGGDDEYGEAS